MSFQVKSIFTSNMTWHIIYWYPCISSNVCSTLLVYKKFQTSSSICKLHPSNMCYHLPYQYELITLHSLVSSLHTCEFSSNTLSLLWILFYSFSSGCMSPTKRIMDIKLSDLKPHSCPDQLKLPPLHLHIQPYCCLIFPFNQDLPTFGCLLVGIRVITCEYIILCDWTIISLVV